MRLIPPKIYAFVRIAAAAAILITIAYQLHVSLTRYHADAVNFFSYFTILSNLIFAGALVASAACAWFGKGRCTALEYARGGAVIYMVTTGIVYGLLLSGYETSHHITTPNVNLILHQIMPLFATIDWVFAPQRVALRKGLVWSWLAFPFLYMAYTLVRGPHVDWYPYPFLDPRGAGGYWRVVGYAVSISLGMSLCVLLVGWSRMTQENTGNPKKPRRQRT